MRPASFAGAGQAAISTWLPESRITPPMAAGITGYVCVSTELIFTKWALRSSYTFG